MPNQNIRECSDAQRLLRSEVENLFSLIRAEAWTVASEHAEYIANELANLAKRRRVAEQAEIAFPQTQPQRQFILAV
jgi:hypothetical protein